MSNENIKTWPEEVYLQHGYNREVPDYVDCPDGEISWCDEIMDALDVRYIRVDIAKEREEKLVQAALDGGYHSSYDVHDLAGLEKLK